MFGANYRDVDEFVSLGSVVDECGRNHGDCVYNRAYPDALVRTEYGLLRPEEFCPNKAKRSVAFLATQLADESEREEASC